MPVLKGLEAKVAKGYGDALIKAIKGERALSEEIAAKTRKIAQEQVVDDWEANEYECRYWEHKLSAAAVFGDLEQFASFLREIGKSKRFDVDRLHEIVDLAGAHLQTAFCNREKRRTEKQE